MLLTSLDGTWYRITGMVSLAVLLLWPLQAWARDIIPLGVSWAETDKAIVRGTTWLQKHAWQKTDKADESAWITRQAVVIQAGGFQGVPAKNENVKAWLKAVRNHPPTSPLDAALRVPAIKCTLWEPAREHNAVLPYALFLADNQAKDGSWGKGRAVDPPLASMLLPEPAMQSEQGPFRMRGRRAIRRTLVRRRTWGDPGDVLHTGYAMLGWGACLNSGLIPDRSALALTETWWTETQNEDGGWGHRKGEPSRVIPTLLGMAGLSACLYMHPGRIKDVRIQKAGIWLGNHLTYGELKGTGTPSRWFWLFCVKRAGDYSGRDWFGELPWYREGANWLMTTQHEDGSWGVEAKPAGRVLDTCWAIIFLKRRRIHYHFD